MDDSISDRKRAGFKRRTPVEDALETLRAAVLSLDRGPAALTNEADDEDQQPTPDADSVGRVPVSEAAGRVLATPVTANRDVPHYERAAMDGYAVKAEDTHGASPRSPAVLRVAPDDRVDPGTAVRVHTGSALPDGANAVVMIEHVEEIGGTDELEVEDALASGENVAPVGEDVTSGTGLYEPGHRLRPSDLGLLRSVGLERVPVVERPTVGVIPTGEELVEHDPKPGEVIETNGLTVSTLVEQWGGRAAYRDVVTDDFDALRAAIERDLTNDVVVTTGGSSVGERDLLPEVIDDLGEVLVHGVALKPGHPVCLGIVRETPVLALPGYPVACIVNAVQFLRPTLRWLEGTEPEPHPTVAARLDRKLPSEPGTRTFARVSLEPTAGGEHTTSGTDAESSERTVEAKHDGHADPDYRAIPTRASGAGVLSSVALADGWVVVGDSREGIPAGETVAVELWEGLPTRR